MGGLAGRHLQVGVATKELHARRSPEEALSDQLVLVCYSLDDIDRVASGGEAGAQLTAQGGPLREVDIEHTGDQKLEASELVGTLNEESNLWKKYTLYSDRQATPASKQEHSDSDHQATPSGKSQHSENHATHSRPSGHPAASHHGHKYSLVLLVLNVHTLTLTPLLVARLILEQAIDKLPAAGAPMDTTNTKRL